MELTDLLDGLQARAPWISAGRPILKSAGFTIHRGYENTIKAAKKEPREDEREILLKDALIEHVVAGEKLIRLIKLHRDEKKKIQSWIAAKRQTKNPLSDAFPGVASNSDIADHQGKGLCSVGSVELQSGIAAIYTSSRGYLDRVDISPAALTGAKAGDYEKIVGLKRVFIQAYDVIWIPEDGDFVCLATDFPRKVPSQFADAAQNELQAQVRRKLDRPLEFVNFWPAVDGLYGAVGGKLVDYGFSVAGKSVNHHKARRRSECLRKAVYDAAGATAVGDDLQLFKVAMQWSVDHEGGLISEPEVVIPGVAADLNRANVKVDHVVLRDGLSSRDLDFVLSKLLPHAT